MKTLFRCEHCLAMYEKKKRAKRCHEDLGGIISKFTGEMKRIIDRQNKQRGLT